MRSFATLVLIYRIWILNDRLKVNEVSGQTSGIPFFIVADRQIIWREVLDDVFARYCAGGARFLYFLFLSSCNCANKYERGGAIDGSITQSMDFIPMCGPVRDETGETHQRSNALIHGWGKYPWMTTSTNGVQHMYIQKLSESMGHAMAETSAGAARALLYIVGTYPT